MKHTRKYMVVPYINPLEKPTESAIQDLDKNMTDVITDKNLSPDNKMKLYSQNLNRFLLKYDPDSYGMTPTLSKLAQVVTEYLEKNNDPTIIDNDLKPLLLKSETPSNTSLLSSPNYNNDNFKFNSDYYTLNQPNNSFLDNTTNAKTPRYDANANNQLYHINTNPLYNNETATSSNQLYPMNTNPAYNTRTKTLATHSKDLQNKRNIAITINNPLKVVHSPKRLKVQYLI